MRFGLLATLAFVVSCGRLVHADTRSAIDFNRDIRPILSDHCFACHGPDSAQRKAELRLDTLEGQRGAGESGARIVVPGDAAASELVRRINAADADDRMPPAEHPKPLSDAQRATLARWVAEGAEFSVHWAFAAPRRPELPGVRRADWPVNAIDRFVLARLEAEGVSPSPEADRRTLIRRVCLDLTGLPPSVEEVEAFVADTSADAYERVVDRLLGSPRYGERMAQHWLDLARYADSDGYHDDTTRAMWPYRDYVIRSFNANKRFDAFTVEQIAGDQIPDSTVEQRVGSAFHRNGPTSSEGGADPAEYRVKYAVDRVATTAAVWLGMTLQCAECHDHKFDPISQREFYQLMAFFDQVPGDPLFRGLYAPPNMIVPDADQQAKLAELDAQIAAMREAGGDAAAVEAVQAERKKLADSIPRLRVMADGEQRTPTHVLIRGDYRRHGERVTPGVPAVFDLPLPEATTPRLALARWLTDRRNPMPARVTVNRFWAMLFGVGLVKTANDLGSQGEWPSHRELLDWLAVEFATDWDVKRMLKLMVMSATYRQASIATPAAIGLDPENRLLARGPRVRLSAEMVRDNALSIAGILTERIGGPSVKPYQPGDLWKEMSYGDAAGKEYVQDHGPDLYRRGLYTFWKRSILYPAFAVFDAPNREECVVTRPRTNTPLQALVTLNDVTYVEAARVFAERIMRHTPDAGDPIDARLDYAFGRAVARPPNDAERRVLRSIYADLLAHYRNDTEAAKRITTVGEWPRAEGLDPVEHAAWTAVAQAILNLDQTLTKE